MYVFLCRHKSRDFQNSIYTICVQYEKAFIFFKEVRCTSIFTLSISELKCNTYKIKIRRKPYLSNIDEVLFNKLIFSLNFMGIFKQKCNFHVLIVFAYHKVITT